MLFRISKFQIKPKILNILPNPSRGYRKLDDMKHKVKVNPKKGLDVIFEEKEKI